MIPCFRKKALAQIVLLVLSALVIAANVAVGAIVDPAISPTVNPTLAPTSSIQLPLVLSADESSVWKSSATQEQFQLLSGHVNVKIAYRTIKGDQAALWLTPSREGGENTYDVAVYLAGNVQVKEGDSARSTTTIGKELLVTTRIARNVQYFGPAPVSRVGEDSAVFKRGNELRHELLDHPAPPFYLPQMFTTTSAEAALQSGWIARDHNNHFVPGPGEIQVVLDTHGNPIPGAVPSAATQPAKPPPQLFIVAGPEPMTGYIQGNERVVVGRNPYALYYARDGKPPIEFRAHYMVSFSPNVEEKDAATEPATRTAASAGGVAGAQIAPGSTTASGPASRPAGGGANEKEKAPVVTGIYFEGDVTIDQGDQLMVRAERIYYDFTSKRAIMLDATLSTVDEVRNIPLYMRAAEIRQLSRSEFAARKATFSTSEFHTPHYHIGASSIYLRDVTPVVPSSAARGAQGVAGGAGGGGGFDLGLAAPGGGGGPALAERTFEFEARDATINIQGVPVFYWPMLSGDTAKNEIPLRTIRISNSRTYGLSLMTDWDLFGLMGQPEPKGVRTDLNLDYFGKRGPAAGVQANWVFDDDHGLLRSYAILEQGTDRLGNQREDITPSQNTRGRITLRDQRDLGDGLTLQLEGSYVSDPTFLEQFFQREFDTDKEHETSIYLKKQGETDALSLLGKFNAMGFTASADQVDDQFTTEKKPEIKYYRIGDSLLDLFTYYSESSASYLDTKITNFTPGELGLLPQFMAPPASLVPVNTKYRDYYRTLGFTTSDVLRADTRHEIDMPLQIGDAKVTPYISGRFTFWDESFPDLTGTGAGSGGDTTRAWGAAGIRSSMTFWHVYNEAESIFLDVHRLRHIIEPQFNLFIAGANQDRSELQPFDRDVEGIFTGSGTQIALRQKWETKRPNNNDPSSPDHWRNVDWITLNIAWNQYWNKDENSAFFPLSSVRGFYFASRPELSLVANSIDVDGTWRVGEHFRLMGEANYGLDSHRIEQFATGLAVDQTSTLSYFIGNRYIQALNTDEWTVALDYMLTSKYQLIAAESYDFQGSRNILTSFTVIRHLPRFNTALTITYDANNSDTSVVFTAWPEGLPSAFGSNAGSNTRLDRRQGP